MTINELCDLLPNGIHDGQIDAISVDYLAATATFRINLWVGDLESRVYEIREKYRKATLTIRGLRFLTMELPDRNYAYELPRTIAITSNDDVGESETNKFFEGDPMPAFHHYLYISEWNSKIVFAGDDCELSFDDGDNTLPFPQPISIDENANLFTSN